MLSSEEPIPPRRRRTPSFSSSLLDAIYRSIDDSKSDHHHHHDKKHTKNSSFCDKEFNKNRERAMMIETWVEKQSITSTSSSSESSKPSTGGFSKTKLKALKLYGELKKVKQPISPGGRIANFLSSIFGSSNSTPKKAKMCYVGASNLVDNVNDIGIGKSCLRAKGQRDVKRSVKFYPVSVVLGEDPEMHRDQPCLMRTFCDDDDDDELSCSSSDLFEIDHLVGVGRYREELPVYETTSLKTNQAIANGFIF